MKIFRSIIDSGLKYELIPVIKLGCKLLRGDAWIRQGMSPRNCRSGRLLPR